MLILAHSICLTLSIQTWHSEHFSHRSYDFRFFIDLKGKIYQKLKDLKYSQFEKKKKSAKDSALRYDSSVSL